MNLKTSKTRKTQENKIWKRKSQTVLQRHISARQKPKFDCPNILQTINRFTKFAHALVPQLLPDTGSKHWHLQMTSLILHQPRFLQNCPMHCVGHLMFWKSMDQSYFIIRFSLIYWPSLMRDDDDRYLRF